MDLTENRESLLYRLLDVMGDELGILLRRLTKSGPNHFAVARFDALDQLASTCFRELDAQSSESDSAVDRLMTRLSELNAELDGMVAAYEELDDTHSRGRRTRERSQRLAEDMKGAAGYRKVRPFSMRSKIESDESDSVSKIESPAAPEDAPLALSGVFTKRRSAH